MAAQYRALSANVRHVISVTVDDPQSMPLYSFTLVSLSFHEQVIPNRGRIFQYRSDYPCIEIEQLSRGNTRTS